MKPAQEQWRRFSRLHEVSDMGRVRNADTGHILALTRTKRGYMTVGVFKGQRKVHRLVLEAFVGPCPDGAETRHLDGNSRNNRLDNLVWGTRTANTADKLAHGRIARGERHGLARLTEAQALEALSSNESHTALARRFGVDVTAIYQLRKGKTWKHLHRRAA